jgi:hypothetical protein
MRRLFVFLLFAMFLAACGAPESSAAPVATAVQSSSPAAAATAETGPCGPTALQSYRATYSDIYSRWSLAMITAGKVRPTDLGTPIDLLQKISAEVAALSPPQCAQQANAETTQAMKQIIAGYQSLRDGKSVGDDLTSGIDMLALARDKVNALPGTLEPTRTPAPTVTPLPTFTPIPTNTPTSTPTPSPTPKPHNGIIDTKNAQVFDSPTGTTPIKTLVRGTRVLVFELQRGRLHIKAGAIDGWVSQSAVLIQ